MADSNPTPIWNVAHKLMRERSRTHYSDDDDESQSDEENMPLLAAARVAKWASAAREKVSMKNFYEQIREQYSGAVASQSVKFKKDRGEEVKLQEQGCADFYRQDALEARKNHRVAPLTKERLALLWKYIPKIEGPQGDLFINYNMFYVANAKIFVWLVPDGLFKDFDKLVKEDWKNEVKADPKQLTMTRGEFVSAMFDIADVWTMSLELSEYLLFFDTVIIPQVKSMSDFDPFDEFDVQSMFSSGPRKKGKRGKGGRRGKGKGGGMAEFDKIPVGSVSSRGAADSRDKNSMGSSSSESTSTRKKGGGVSGDGKWDKMTVYVAGGKKITKNQIEDLKTKNADDHIRRTMKLMSGESDESDENSGKVRCPDEVVVEAVNGATKHIRTFTGGRELTDEELAKLPRIEIIAADTDETLDETIFRRRREAASDGGARYDHGYLAPDPLQLSYGTEMEGFIGKGRSDRAANSIATAVGARAKARLQPLTRRGRGVADGDAEQLSGLRVEGDGLVEGVKASRQKSGGIVGSGAADGTDGMYETDESMRIHSYGGGGAPQVRSSKEAGGSNSPGTDSETNFYQRKQQVSDSSESEQRQSDRQTASLSPDHHVSEHQVDQGFMRIVGADGQQQVGIRKHRLEDVDGLFPHYATLQQEAIPGVDGKQLDESGQKQRKGVKDGTEREESEKLVNLEDGEGKTEGAGVTASDDYDPNASAGMAGEIREAMPPDPSPEHDDAQKRIVQEQQQPVQQQPTEQQQQEPSGELVVAVPQPLGHPIANERNNGMPIAIILPEPTVLVAHRAAIGRKLTRAPRAAGPQGERGAGQLERNDQLPHAVKFPFKPAPPAPNIKKSLNSRNADVVVEGAGDGETTLTHPMQHFIESLIPRGYQGKKGRKIFCIDAKSMPQYDAYGKEQALPTGDALRIAKIYEPYDQPYLEHKLRNQHVQSGVKTYTKATPAHNDKYGYGQLESVICSNPTNAIALNAVAHATIDGFIDQRFHPQTTRMTEHGPSLQSQHPQQQEASADQILQAAISEAVIHRQTEEQRRANQFKMASHSSTALVVPPANDSQQQATVGRAVMRVVPPPPAKPPPPSVCLVAEFPPPSIPIGKSRAPAPPAGSASTNKRRYAEREEYLVPAKMRPLAETAPPAANGVFLPEIQLPRRPSLGTALSITGAPKTARAFFNGADGSGGGGGVTSVWELAATPRDVVQSARGEAVDRYRAQQHMLLMLDAEKEAARQKAKHQQMFEAHKMTISRRPKWDRPKSPAKDVNPFSSRIPRRPAM